MFIHIISNFKTIIPLKQYVKNITREAWRKRIWDGMRQTILIQTSPFMITTIALKSYLEIIAREV